MSIKEFLALARNRPPTQGFPPEDGGPKYCPPATYTVESDTPEEESTSESPHQTQVSTCYGWSTVVSDLDVEGFVLNVDGGSWQELGYNKARTTERWINTQGESACQALKRIGRQGLYKVCQRKRDEVQGLYKVCTERMYRGSCRGSTKYTTRTK
jgi:hypothetical protein